MQVTDELGGYIVILSEFNREAYLFIAMICPALPNLNLKLLPLCVCVCVCVYVCVCVCVCAV
jgi:hypothetical protein